MAVQANDSNAGVEKPYYVGKENVKVVGFNPTKAQLIAQGVRLKEEDPEIEYMSEVEVKDATGNTIKVPQVRLSLQVDNADEANPLKTSINLYVANTGVYSSTGKTQFTNKFGQFAYLPSDGSIPENMTWFSVAGMRPALKGEESFVGLFLKNYLNTAKDAECQIENWNKVFSGDFSEIANLFTLMPNNKVGVLFGVKRTEGDEGKVKFSQTCFTRTFFRQWSKDNTPLVKALDDFRANGGAANVQYGSFPFTFTKVNPSELGWLGAETPTNNSGTPAPVKAAF